MYPKITGFTGAIANTASSVAGAAKDFVTRPFRSATGPTREVQLTQPQGQAQLPHSQDPSQSPASDSPAGSKGPKYIKSTTKERVAEVYSSATGKVQGEHTITSYSADVVGKDAQGVAITGPKQDVKSESEEYEGKDNYQIPLRLLHGQNPNAQQTVKRKAEYQLRDINPQITSDIGTALTGLTTGVDLLEDLFTTEVVTPKKARLDNSASSTSRRSAPKKTDDANTDDTATGAKKKGGKKTSTKKTSSRRK